jgi:cytochrome P450
MNLDAIPTVPGGTRLGHMTRFQHDRLPFLLDAMRAGDLSRLRFLHKNVLMVSGPQASHEVLVEKARHFEKSPGLRLLLYYFAGDGLFTSEGELWKRQRRLMSPLFQPSQLARYGGLMRDVTLRALERLGDGERVDLARETTRIAMGVVGKALFDSDTFDEADELGEILTTGLRWTDANAASPGLVAHIALLDAAQRAGELAPTPLRAPLNQLHERLKEPFLLPGAHSPALRGAVRRLDARIQQMIDERRAQGLSRDDLLTRLLAARDDEGGTGERMTDKQVRDEVTTLFVAGHETTATSLAWAFYLLGRDPSVRDAVQAEVDALDADPDFATVARLPLTLRVFKEAMRLYPPVIVLARRALTPVEIAGQRLPERTIVFVSPYGVHYNPAVWPDPTRLDPSGFTPEAEAARPRSAYLPFGAGPRVCLGNHFALLEGPIVLATLMRHARFETDPARVVEPETFATLRPRGGVPAVVRRRDARA